jgi:predicted RecB family endonuclease
MSKKQYIKLNKDAMAIIENQCVSIVQELFKDKMVIVLSIDDIKTILKEYEMQGI